MNIPRIAAVALLALPASAVSAPHTITVRVTQGGRAYTHTVKAEPGRQTNFKGQSGGQNMIVNGLLERKADAFTLMLQLEVSRPDRSRSFQVQSSVALRAGDRVRAVECGDWTLDLSLDASGSGSPPAWNPAGPNYRLTSFAGQRRCRVVQEAVSQSNINDSASTGGRRSGFILNTMLARPAGNSCRVQYQMENSGQQAQGEENLVLGRKTAVRGGRLELLLEGPAPARPAAAAAPSPAPSEQGGAVPLLR